MKVWCVILASIVCLCSVGCGGGPAEKIAALTGDSSKGATVWQNCQSCHGADGKGTTLGPDLTKAPGSDVSYINTILNGDGTMPAFKGQLSDQDIADVVSYIRKDLQGK